MVKQIKFLVRHKFYSKWGDFMWFPVRMMSYVHPQKINMYPTLGKGKKPIFPIATFEGDMLVSLEGKSIRSWNQGSDGFFVVSVYNLVCSGARCSNTVNRFFQDKGVENASLALWLIV